MKSRVRAIYTIDICPAGPARAREIVARELSSVVPEQALDDVKLMVSELVTSGVRHGDVAKARKLALDLLINGIVRCTVTEQRAPHAPAGLAMTRGWGLHLVEQLADRWGVRRTEDTTQVWFETEPC